MLLNEKNFLHRRRTKRNEIAYSMDEFRSERKNRVLVRLNRRWCKKLFLFLSTHFVACFNLLVYFCVGCITQSNTWWLNIGTIPTPTLNKTQDLSETQLRISSNKKYAFLFKVTIPKITLRALLRPSAAISHRLIEMPCQIQQPKNRQIWLLDDFHRFLYALDD